MFNMGIIVDNVRRGKWDTVWMLGTKAYFLRAFFLLNWTVALLVSSLDVIFFFLPVCRVLIFSQFVLYRHQSRLVLLKTMGSLA